MLLDTTENKRVQLLCNRNHSMWQWILNNFYRDVEEIYGNGFMVLEKIAGNTMDAVYK